MKVKDCMTPDVRIVQPDQSLREAARLMAESDLGSLPVGENDRLVGIVTLGDLTASGSDKVIGEALGGIVRPSGLHSQNIPEHAH